MWCRLKHQQHSRHQLEPNCARQCLKTGLVDAVYGAICTLLCFWWHYHSPGDVFVSGGRCVPYWCANRHHHHFGLLLPVLFFSQPGMHFVAVLNCDQFDSLRHDSQVRALSAGRSAYPAICHCLTWRHTMHTLRFVRV